MAERREALNNDRKNYPNGFKFPMCLLEENLKVLNVQLNQCSRLCQSCTNIVRGLYKGLSKATTPWKDSTMINGQFDSFLAFQESYIGLVRDFANKLMKETIILSQINAENAISFFDSHLCLLS
jgi:hypothetical protein